MAKSLNFAQALFSASYVLNYKSNIKVCYDAGIYLELKGVYLILISSEFVHAVSFSILCEIVKFLGI